MILGRRQFLATAGAVAVSASKSVQAFAPRIGTAEQAGRTAVFPAAVRADFPIVAHETYMNSAALHPLGTFAGRAVEQCVAYRVHGPGDGRVDFGAAKQDELKKKYGTLIGATPTEIDYCANTSDGENIVVMGLDLPKRGGNVVIDELHFTTSLYMYKELEKKGVELRIVKHRNWAIDPKDMERVIDKNTRLVS